MRQIIIILISCTLASNFSLSAQCYPPPADKCQDAHTICSMQELDGFKCAVVSYSNPTACLPCKGKGGPHNTSWWAFIAEGGRTTIKISIYNCIINGTGVQFGIESACDCSEQVFCYSDCATSGEYTLIADLIPNKKYYFWMDGCTGDVCDFTMRSSLGGTPNQIIQKLNILLWKYVLDAV